VTLKVALCSVLSISAVMLCSEAKGLESRLETEAKPIKKGLVSSEIVDFKWRKKNSQLLNPDSDVRCMLLREELDQLPRTKIGQREEHQ
jgi:hypothetical protein